MCEYRRSQIAQVFWGKCSCNGVYHGQLRQLSFKNSSDTNFQLALKRVSLYEVALTSCRARGLPQVAGQNQLPPVAALAFAIGLLHFHSMVCDAPFRNLLPCMMQTVVSCESALDGSSGRCPPSHVCIILQHLAPCVFLICV